MRASVIGWGVAVALVVGVTSVASAAVTGYEGYADWSSLPRLPVGSAAMASSYSRTAADSLNDYNNYDGPSTDGYALVRDVTGPGFVTRFWMPHHSSNAPAPIRLTIDGTQYVTDSTALFNGTFGGGTRFQAPLVRTLVGGRVSYEPIAFQNSLRIETAGGGRANFYQWEYRRLPAGTAVATYNANGGLTGPAPTPRQQAAATVNRTGANPAGADPGAVGVSRTNLTIPAGGTVTLADVAGSGQVRSLLMNLRGSGGTNPPDAVLDAVRVRVRYDGSAAAAVDVPVSHYFGVGHGRADYKSLPLGVDAGGNFYSHWPMPYRQGVTVELYNAGTSAVAVPSASVEYAPGAVAADAGYLHAVHREQTTAPGQRRYNMLTAAGAGHYVGNLLYVDGFGGTLESNDIITIDGTNTLTGTGLEDAYNGGYYYNHAGDPYTVSDNGDTPFPASGDSPFHGLLRFGSTNSTDQYRWRINDAVPFSSGLTVDMENFTYNGYGQAGVRWGSTAFYYLQVPEPTAIAPLALAGTWLLASRRRRAVWA